VYSMTRMNIVRVLGDAARRGVTVHVKYDDASAREWEPMSKAVQQMKKKGVTCTAIKMPAEYGRMHHKFIVIDGKRVLTGSYNFTTAATVANYENLVLIASEPIAQAFGQEFDRITSK
jgi:phosphatidylserine/phosphatidylglycerophosphate/cardiolipin synthase-like enzyme